MPAASAVSSGLVVITGATSGLGLVTAQALAAQGVSVIGVGRSPERCSAAEQIIHQAQPDACITYLLADLASQRQIRQLAESIRAIADRQAGGRVNVLINNAATVSNWYTVTEDGCELQFAVNHLAPFLLTHELLPLLRAAPAGRVVTVTSWAHRRARLYWPDLMLRRRYGVLKAYQQSKLANVLFSYEFNRRYAGNSEPRAYAADPGLVNTEIGLKGTSGLARLVWNRRRRKGATPEQGAETILFVATDASVNGTQAVYWKHCQPWSPSEYAQREDEAARLWDFSARLCGI